MKHTYSVWIAPPPKIAHILQDVIDALAQELGGSAFQPHMTLLGDILGKNRISLKK